MTEVGNVNVTLGLNSDAFVKAWSDADDKMKELERNLKKSKRSFQEVSLAMAGTKNPSKELVNTFNELKNKLKEDQSAFDKFNDKLKELDGGLTQGKTGVNLLQGALVKLAGPAAAIAAAKKLYDLGKAAVDTASKFEQLEVSFEVLAGGADAGKRLTDQIIELASKTPLTTEALSDGARTLLSFGEASDEVVNDLKLLGDITGGDAQRMQSLTLAFAQVGSTGRLMGQDLMQMVNAGFNPLSIMSEKTGKSMAQLKDEMSKGLITFKDVKQAMIDATSEGGRFYGMMNKQSETLEGRLSTLDDTWQLVSKNMGDMFLPVAKKCTEWLIKLGNAALDAINKLKAVQERARLFSRNIDNAALSTEELNKKLKILSEYENNLLYSSDKAYAGARHQKDFKKRIADIEKEKNELIALYKARKQNEPKNVKEESKGFLGMSSTGTNAEKSKKTRDKALDEYKKYIEQYNKLNNDYQSVLKAREYVEKTLNIDPVTQQQDYDKAVELYKNYFSKMQEIAMSGAKNKAELQKLEEENLARQLQEIEVTKALETQRKLNDIVKGYQDERKNYEITQQAEQELGGFIGRFATGYQERLELLKWYYKEREKISAEHYATLEDQQKVFNELDQNYAMKSAQIQKDIWNKRGQEIQSIFSQTFDTMLTNYGDFSENMQQLALNLTRYMIKEIFESAFSQLVSMQNIQGSMSEIFGQMFNQANNLATSYISVAQGAAAANASTQAMTATQSTLAPISGKLANIMAGTAGDYAKAAAEALQLAAATAQLAVSQAAASVAKIPYVGGFLAPVAAALTGAAIAAATAMVAGGSVVGKAGAAISGISGRSSNPVSGGGGMMYQADPMLPMYHSGGVVPGTKEQLALVKGGERVLNPAENAAYTSSQEGENAQGGVNNIMMFNIKAWDGKDVINTLKANSQTINQIVSSGIKNNNQGLRTTVQNI